MMSGNPNWWSMHPQISSSSQFVYGSSLLSSNQDDNNNNNQPNQDFPLRSWTQLLRGDGGGEEKESSSAFDQQQKKLESWEDQVLNLNQATCFSRVLNDDVKQELSNTTCQLFGRLDQQQDHDDQFHHVANNNNRAWNQVMMPHVSSPNSCITTLSNNNNNFLNFSGARKATEEKRRYHQHQDHSSHECNSTSSGGVSNKKPRVQQSSPQPALKVRKEKLGDRITALHQLVSPFGKTDTASVLSEAIGYIRFLQSQIEALSSPYMRNASGSTGSSSHQHSVQERSCLFPQEPNQFLNHDTGIDVRAASMQDSQGQAANDLRSRGLCLVPIACTQHIGNDNGADYWAPAALGGGF